MLLVPHLGGDQRGGVVALHRGRAPLSHRLIHSSVPMIRLDTFVGVEAGTEGQRGLATERRGPRRRAGGESAVFDDGDEGHSRVTSRTVEDVEAKGAPKERQRSAKGAQPSRAASCGPDRRGHRRCARTKQRREPERLAVAASEIATCLCYHVW